MFCGFKLISSEKSKGFFFVVVLIDHSGVLNTHFLIVVVPE